MKKGFTLVELLIVIAILGTLAVVVLLAIDPVQQIAKTRDAGRKSGVAQLGKAIEAFGTSNGGLYPAYTANWAQNLVDAGEIQILPSRISGGTACTLYTVNTTWCYNSNSAVLATSVMAIVFVRLESKDSINKCVGDVNGTIPYFLYSTVDKRSGFICNTTNPTAVVAGWAARFKD